MARVRMTTHLEYAKLAYAMGLIDAVELEYTTERMLSLGVADRPPLEGETLPFRLLDSPDFDERIKRLGGT